VAERDPFSVLRARMDAIGFRPSSVLGQNFLLDPSLHRWIAERAAPTAADTVVEIGVGLGFLTRELAARAGRVVAVEIDDRLLQLAQEELAGVTNVHWVHGDALAGPGRTLHPEIVAAVAGVAAAGARCLVVANLPYAVSGPLLAELVALPAVPARCVLLVQKEMAQRVAAPPGGDDYGSLSALLQSVARVQVLRDVPPQVFRPRPKVVSAILEAVRDDAAPLARAEAAERRAYAGFVRQLFQQRRKVLRTTLAAAAAAVGRQPPALAADLQNARAESLGPARLVELFRACEVVRGG
jgi:16S rRNA (adenine1518-N6/adenine1519-N6)-dimethyltransferase